MPDRESSCSPVKSSANFFNVRSILAVLLDWYLHLSSTGAFILDSEVFPSHILLRSAVQVTSGQVPRLSSSMKAAVDTNLY